MPLEISSGGSTVLVKKNSNWVFQRFNSKEVAERVGGIALKLVENNKIEYRILFQKGFGQRKTILLDKIILYRAFDYIVPFEYYIPSDRMIVWRKIEPLNKLKENQYFLSENWLKIWYDISKALYALKNIGIMHNDTVIDNIGIYRGKFVLFDFDGSGTPDDKGKDFSDDFVSLKKSFTFHGVDKGGFHGIASIVEFISKTKGISLTDALDYLETLEINKI